MRHVFFEFSKSLSILQHFSSHLRSRRFFVRRWLLHSQKSWLIKGMDLDGWRKGETRNSKLINGKEEWERKRTEGKKKSSLVIFGTRAWWELGSLGSLLFSRHIIEQSSFLEPSSSSDRAERRRASYSEVVAAALLLLRRLRAFAFSVSEKTSSWDLLKRVSPEINRQKLGKFFHFEIFKGLPKITLAMQSRQYQ